MIVCPHCGSRKAKKINYLGASCIVCPDCSYSECDQLDVIDEPKTSQKEKGRYSPYKTGGSRRTNN